MEIDKRILLTPGPVHIDSGRWSSIIPLHHRTESFRQLVLEIERMLQDLAGTGSPAYLLTASGTGAIMGGINLGGGGGQPGIGTSQEMATKDQKAHSALGWQ